MATSGADRNHLGSVIAVTTSIRRSISPLMPDLLDEEMKIRLDGEAEMRRRSAVSPFESTPETENQLASIRKIEYGSGKSEEPTEERVKQSFSSFLPGRNGFEQSPGWHDHYAAPVTKPIEEETYFPVDQLRWPGTNSGRRSSEMTYTTKTIPDSSSMTTAEISSRKFLCLMRPPPRNILRAGNSRLKSLMRQRPKSNGYMLAPSESEDERKEKFGKRKIDIHMPKKGFNFATYKRKKPPTSVAKTSDPQPIIRTKKSSSSIIDLNRVDNEDNQQKYHNSDLSKSWDDLYESVTKSVGHDDPKIMPNMVFRIAEGESLPSDCPAPLRTSSRNEIPKEVISEPIVPPKPGPRTSSMKVPKVSFSQERDPRYPARSTSTRGAGMRRSNHPRQGIDRDQSLQIRGEKSNQLRRNGSLDRVGRYGPGPNASQSTLNLESIEDLAGMKHDKQPSSSGFYGLSQPFCFNKTPPQPVTAPSEPPIGPLPDLPEEYDRTDAASRMSSNTSSPTRLYRPPVVAPLSHHRRSSSANSAASRTTTRAKRSNTAIQRKQSNGSSSSPRKPTSVRSVRTIPTGGAALPTTTTEYCFAEAVENSVTAVPFNRFNLGHSQDMRSTTTKEGTQDGEAFDKGHHGSPKRQVETSEAFRTRNQNIKSLKKRDLAKEKEIRGRSRPNSLEVTDVSTNGNVFRLSKIEQGRPHQPASHSSTRHSKEIERPDPSNEESRPASRTEQVKRYPSQASRRASSRQSSHRSGHRSGHRSVLSSSQIMVLAETDPETQTFRASTPTGSLQRAESINAEPVVLQASLRTKYNSSQQYSRSQSNRSKFGRGSIRSHSSINGQQTPPLSDPSEHSSDDAIFSPHRVRSWTHLKQSHRQSHIADQARDDAEMNYAQSSRRLAALAARSEEQRFSKHEQELDKVKREASLILFGVKKLLRSVDVFIAGQSYEDRSEGAGRGVGMAEAEMEPSQSRADRYTRSRTPEYGPRYHGMGWGSAIEEDAPHAHRAGGRSSRGGPTIPGSREPRPLNLVNLVSKYNSARNSMGESVVNGPPTEDDLIWDQVDGLNAAKMTQYDS